MKLHRMLLALALLAGPLAAQQPDTLRHSIPAPPVGVQSGANLGSSVAVDGGYTVVGVPNDDLGRPDSGVVKVFDAVTGALLVVLPNPGPGEWERFGSSVAISGSLVVVGSRESGGYDSFAASAYVFDLSSATPAVPVATLNNPGVHNSYSNGNPVAISGTRVVVGAPRDNAGAVSAGSAYVYDLSSGTPTVPVAVLNNPSPAVGESFGSSVGISGTSVVVGTPYDSTGANAAGIAYVYDLGGGTPTVPVATLNNPGPATGDYFGYVVAISGTRVVVGALNDDTGAEDAGSAYVYDMSSGTPTVPVSVLNNPSPVSGERFGYSVAISGTRVVAGTPFDSTGVGNAGSAYVYDLSSGVPTVPVTVLNNPSPATNELFGYAVAIAGTRAVIGAPGDDPGASDAGSAYVYDLSGSTPSVPGGTLNDPGPAPEDSFGTSVAISGSLMVVGAPNEDTGAENAGSAYVYDLGSGTPSVPVFVLNNPSPADYDGFGSAVAISGTRVVVGARMDNTGASQAGSAYVYDLGSATPTVPVATLNNPSPASGDYFGYSVAVSGARVVVGAPLDNTGAPHAGSAYVYDLSSATPTVPAAILSNPNSAVDDLFGLSVGISGMRVVVGTPYDDAGANDAGSAYVYNLSSGTPTVPVATLNNPSPAVGESFGSSVGISGTSVVVGTPYDSTGANAAGIAYVYELGSGTPTVPVATLNNPGPGDYEFFGCSVAISGTRVVVGAFQDDIGADDVGGAYVYDLSGPTPTVPVATPFNPTPSFDDEYGASVAIDGTTVVISAPNDGTVMSGKGSAYVFTPEFTPPAGGTLSLSPATPVDASAALTVAFAGWTDLSTPLSYTVLIDNVIVSPAGATASRNLTGPAAAGAHTLKGRITDAAGNVAEVTQSFQVLSATLTSWQQAQFGGSGPGTGLTESFAGDGIANLLKFAFGMNPTVPGGAALQYTGTFAGGGTVAANGMPTTAFESTPGGLDFRALFVRRTDYVAAGLVYTPMFSPDLLVWEASADTPTVLADDGSYQVVSVPYPLSIGGKKAKFFKLQLSLAP